MCIVDVESPTWRQEDDEMGLEIPPRTAKSAELVNGDQKGPMGGGKRFHSGYIKEKNAV